MGLTAESVVLKPAGYFRIFAKPPGGSARTEITFFRDVPTQILSMTTQDPFGPAQLTLQFPQITMFDRPGSGDLSWLVPYTDIDVVWENYGSGTWEWVWEGFSIDESLNLSGKDTSMTLECKGAMFQLDNYLAKPFFPQQPWPYESLLTRAFLPELHPGLRTQRLMTQWPSDWNKVVPKFTEADYLWFLKPWGVTPGQKWTGLTARATGGWDPTLTGFVQGLLSVMYDEGGTQWTIRLDRGRQPVLFLRRPPLPADPGVLIVDLGTPGVDVQLSRDFTQAANVIYGTGSDNSGTMFSGMQVDNDGNETIFHPFAAARVVFPDSSNPTYNATITRKETQLQFPQGMDELQCRTVAMNQLQRFADPGYTGQITLRTDPYLGVDRSTYPRMLVRAGQSILVRGVRGSTQGVLFHITESAVDFKEGQNQLTIDSKYRDQLTVEEVQARTRDALTPLRMLQTGKLSVTVNDLMKPWSYTEGSGMIPQASKEFFLRRIPDKAAFPWEDWTTKYPPKNASSAKYYLKIPAAQLSAGSAYKNWCGLDRDVDGTQIARAAIPIYMAQKGDIRLTQIAAYDADGHVLPCYFHVGMYYNGGTSYLDMPYVSTNNPRIRQPPGGSFRANDYTPFFEGAFETIRPDGSEYDQPTDVVAEGAAQAIGWGTYYEPAGYSPGLFSRGAPRTGMLVDEQTWGFDTSNYNDFNKYDRTDNLRNNFAGMMYLMLYCDTQGNQPVYFMGRFFRVEPGTT